MIEDFQKRIDYTFKQPELLKQALTHKSYAFEFQQGQGHNERLEFLGDAILDLVLAHELMQRFPDDDEGALSKKRASLVNESVLAEKAQALYADVKRDLAARRWDIVQDYADAKTDVVADIMSRAR